MHTELKDLLNNPQRVTASDAELLRDAVQAYPFFQPLYVLLAIALKDNAADPLEAQRSKTRAALFNHGHLVYTALQHPEELEFKRFAFSKNYVAAAEEEEEPAFEEIADVYSAPSVFETAAPAADLPAAEPDNSVADEAEDEVYEEISELQTLPLVPVSGPVLNIENLAPEDVPDNPVSEREQARRTATQQAGQAETLSDPAESAQPQAAPIHESVASFDFFAFDARFPATTGPADEDREQPLETAADDEGRVSKYHDDALPYTFLWWLAKTRKEYESFRPYANPVKRTGEPAAAAYTGLQQQYVEHIFHIQTPFEAEDLVSDADVESRQKKEADLIDRFIRQQPQINAPEPEKIDTENKAKKSAEDQYDLVTETLAKIYIEQMLYHKAIDTYKKLSLKYPEKSRYFADLIQSIEKKI